MTATTQPILFHTKYRPLFRRKINTRYLLITGGRGSGKSFAVASWACINSTEPAYKQRTLYTRYTLTSAQISIIPEFEEKLDLLGVRPLFDVTAKEIVCRHTGSDIIFSGIKTSSGNQTARLKSIPGLNVFIIEEAEEFLSESDFDVINLSIRQLEAPNLVVIVMNPPTSEHWVWGRWFEYSHKMKCIDGVQVPISTHPDVTHIHTTYLDNRRNLPESYLLEIASLKENNPDKYAHQIIGAWRTQAEGVIFENWQEGEFDESLPYAYGLDFGYFPDPTALVQVAVDEKR
ncbi:MAG: phage terminase large subunit, partial [Phaeodactylibacter sp.]|nr:phage terminase large subunit [Phaeodactylibacter sp.]